MALIKSLRKTISLSTLTISGLAVLITACGGGSGGIGGDEALGEQTGVVGSNSTVAFVRRSSITGTNDDNEPVPVNGNILQPWFFNAGAELILINTLDDQATEFNIIGDSGIFSGQEYDVKDLAVSYDGRKLAFAMREPRLENVDEFAQPTWNIWEYNLDTQVLRRIIESDAQAARGHDVAPQYLPDGRIVFSSSRQVGFREIIAESSATVTGIQAFYSLTEQRDNPDDNDDFENFVGPTFNLHVMNADPDVIDSNGLEVEQITFNQSHDLNPVVLPDGRIAFLRWDRNRVSNNNDQLSIYTIYPDGNDLSFLYGFHNQNSVTNSDGTEEATFFDISVLEDGRLLAILKQRDSTDEDPENMNDGLVNPVLGGDLITIDINNYTENNLTVSGGSGSAQRSLSSDSISINDSISENGYFTSAYPFYDGSNNILVSYSFCLLDDEDNTGSTTCPGNLQNDSTEADPIYNLHIFNSSTGTVGLPRINAGTGNMISDVVLMNERIAPQPIFDSLDARFAANTYLDWLKSVRNNLEPGYGALFIDSVYQFDDAAGQLPAGATTVAEVANPNNVAAFTNRPARFLRVIKPVSFPYDADPDNEILPDFNDDAFGLGNNGNLGMKEILGYIPIQPDGSVAAAIPSRMPFQFDIVDANGERVGGFPRHNNWMQIAPREMKFCVGCHTNTSTAPHSRRGAESASINLGANPGDSFPGMGFSISAEDDVNFGRQTMAEALLASVAGNNQTLPKLSPNMVYQDIWESGVDSEISYRYIAETAALPTAADYLVPNPPIANTCRETWLPTCRIIINYPEHLQPLWTRDRGADTNGDGSLNFNYACINCHTNEANTNPAGFIDLTDNPDPDPNNDYYTISYTDLFGGAQLRQAYQATTDANGNNVLSRPIIDNTDPLNPIIIGFQPILDVDGNTIPLVEPVAVIDPNNNNQLVQVIDYTNTPTNVPLFYMIDATEADPMADPTDPPVQATFNGQPIPITVPFNSNPVNGRMNRNNSAGSAFFDVITVSGNSNNGTYATLPNGTNLTFDHSRLFQDGDGAPPAEFPRSVDFPQENILMTGDELRLIREWLDIGAQYYNNPFIAPQ